MAQGGRDTAQVAKANVDLVRKQTGDVDLARVLRDDDAWAARLADIDSFFMDDFEFVVRVRGEPVTGKALRSSAPSSATGSSPGTPICRRSRRSSTSAIASWCSAATAEGSGAATGSPRDREDSSCTTSRRESSRVSSTTSIARGPPRGRHNHLSTPVRMDDVSRARVWQPLICALVRRSERGPLLAMAGAGLADGDAGPRSRLGDTRLSPEDPSYGADSVSEPMVAVRRLRAPCPEIPSFA
jgi:hypothetical protein